MSPGDPSSGTVRQRALRAARRAQLVIDPDQPPKKCPVCHGSGRRGRRARAPRCETCKGTRTLPRFVHPDPACPHGTEGGYSNWGCECYVTPKGKPGCGVVGTRAPTERRKAVRVNATADTVRLYLPARRKDQPPPT